MDKLNWLTLACAVIFMGFALHASFTEGGFEFVGFFTVIALQYVTLVFIRMNQSELLKRIDDLSDD